ncbi:MAG: S41 family peptidase [Lacibacter sp.]
MKTLFYFFLLLIVYVLSSCSASNSIAYTPLKKFSPQQLKEDMQVLEQTLRYNHPSLTWYNSDSVITASFQRGYSLLNDSLTETQFRNVLSETVFPIRCGHTSVQVSKQSVQYRKNRREKSFPLGMKIINDSTLVVTTNLNRRDSILKTGTKIFAVNGLTAKQIIDTMLPLVSIDGNSKNFSYQNLSNSFTSYYNNRFGLYEKYHVIYYDNKQSLKKAIVNLYNPAGDTFRRAPVVINRFPVQQETQSQRQRKLQRIRSFTIDSTKTYAVLRLNSFGADLRRSYLRKSFRQLRKNKINNLVIDVRNNGGGLIKTSLWLSKQLHHQPFSFTDSVYTKHRKIKTKAQINKRIVYNLGLLFLNRKKNDSLYEFCYFTKKEYSPGKKNYKGQVYLLTGGFSFSATTLFAASVKGLNNVTIIGEETGGAYYGNNGVFIPEMTLPQTKIRIRLPLYRIVNNKNFPKNGSGVLPDIEVKPTEESIRQNRDPKMEKAIEIIKSKK